MKKSVQKPFPLVPVLLFVTVIVLGVVATQWINSKQLDLKSQTTENYGPLGYGRGQGNGQGRMNSDEVEQTLNKDNCLMDGCLTVDDADYPVATLNEKTIEYLNVALTDERKALATYEAVMQKFGKVKPFVNIARAEEQHISMLKAIFDKYGVDISKDDTHVGTLPATLQEVCKVGVEAEIANDALYQKMIPEIQEGDIKTVFVSLARASKDMHLPAFERCAN